MRAGLSKSRAHPPATSQIRLALATCLMNSPTSSPDIDGASVLPIVVLDACVLLNLYASGRVDEILRAVPFRYVVASSVRHEALWYFAPASHGSELLDRHDILLDPLLEAGTIELGDLTLDEQASFVKLAQHLGDGEAESAALAIGRSGLVATDDVKAIQLFGRLTPRLNTIETGDLLQCWEEHSGADPLTVAAVLQAIQRGARFSPRRDARSSTWWQQRIREISLH